MHHKGVEMGDMGYTPEDLEKQVEEKGDDGAKEKGIWCCVLDCARSKELAAVGVWKINKHTFGERTLKGALWCHHWKLCI